MFRPRPLVSVLIALLFLLPGALAGAQAYTSIVIFGDSLCDTGNDAFISKSMFTVNAQVPGPATGYTNGRFTDGTDTLPAARNYNGVWVEQLAAMLAAKPTINYSLAGGQNYAYGFATTNTGQTAFTYGPGNVFSFNVNNMGAQVTSYLATNPTITNKTLFIVWGGANDLINATSSADIQNAAMRDAALVQTLISAGATDFIIPNLPPLGLVPRFNGSVATSAPATAAAAGFNQYLAAYLGALPAANPGKTLHLYQLDIYTLINTIVAAPSARGFANVTGSSSAALTGNPAVNPDTYLFWDDLHPTTYGHNQVALAALALIGTPVSTTTSLSTSNTQPNPGKTFTLTATVTGTTGIPTGTVNFTEGSNLLGSAYVTGSSTSAAATLTTSYATAGTHTITATFTGVNGYSNSSATLSNPITVIAPTLSSSLAYSQLVVPAGTSTTDMLTLTPQGGYTGTATVACGTLPAHFTCSASPASLTLSGNNAAQTSTVTIGTAAMASLTRPFDADGRSRKELVLACGLLPGFGLLSLAALRRKRAALRGITLTGVLVLLTGIASVGLTGCADNGAANIAKPGTYTVPVVVTSNGTTTNLSISVVVQ